eukprot:1377883-Amorphochlora_amoeboformis.AAC.2
MNRYRSRLGLVGTAARAQGALPEIYRAMLVAFFAQDVGVGVTVVHVWSQSILDHVRPEWRYISKWSRLSKH